MANIPHPPAHLIEYIGGSDFKKIGNEFFRYFLKYGKLKRSDRVLDIGCGCGRMAIPLSTYLRKPGIYYGVDISEEAISWCNSEISNRFTNFSFKRINVVNSAYLPNGVISDKDYLFPYENNSFDFIFLISVFTHMLPLGFFNYLKEIYRILNLGGNCFMTFYLMNKSAEVTKKRLVSRFQHMCGGKYALVFRNKFSEGCYVIDQNIPELAVSYEEDYVKKCCAEVGFSNPWKYFAGRWSGRQGALSHQDIIIIQK